MYMPKSAIPLQQSPQPTVQPKTGYMPKSAVPVQPEKTPTGLGYLGGLVKNIPKSFVDTIGGVAKATVNVFNPDWDNNTLYNIGKLATGVAQKFTPGVQKEEEVANQVGQFYKDRYGGVENIKNTLYNDPVGVGLDVASVVSGVGAGVKGAGLVSKVPSLVKAGSTLSKVGSAIDPLAQTGRAVGAVTEPLFSKIKPGLAAKSDEIITAGLGGGKKLGQIEKKQGRSVASFIKEYGKEEPGLLARKPEAAEAVKELIGERFDTAAMQSGKSIKTSEFIGAIDDKIAELKQGFGGEISSSDADKIAKMQEIRDKFTKAIVQRGQLEEIVPAQYKKVKTKQVIPELDREMTASLNRNNQPLSVEPVGGKKVYHATNKQFDNFDISKAKTDMGGAKAIFFSETPEGTKYYQRGENSRVIETNISPEAKIFDYQNPEHTALLENFIQESSKNKPEWGDSLRRLIKSGEWGTIEGKDIQGVIKKLGFDGFYDMDMTGHRAIGITNPKVISPSPLGNASPSKPLSVEPVGGKDIGYQKSQEMLNRYGKAERPTDVGFITKNGDAINYDGFNKHEDMVKSLGYTGKNRLENYLNDTGDVRVSIPYSETQLNIEIRKPITQQQYNQIEKLSPGKKVFIDNYINNKSDPESSRDISYLKQFIESNPNPSTLGGKVGEVTYSTKSKMISPAVMEQPVFSPLKTSVADITSFRRKVIEPDTKTKDFVFGADKVSGAKEVRNIARAKTTKYVPELEKLGMDYGMAKEVEKLVSDYSSRQSARQLWNFSKLGSAGIMAFIGGIPGMVGGFIAERIVNDPRFLSAVSGIMEEVAKTKEPGTVSKLFSKTAPSAYLFGKAGRMTNPPSQTEPILSKAKTQLPSPEAYTPIIQPSATPYQVPQIRRPNGR